MSGQVAPDVCVFCKFSCKDGRQIVKLTQKGVDGILRAAQARNETILVKKDQKVHSRCRLEYTNTKALALLQKQITEPSTSTSLKRTSRASALPFSLKTHCLFCGKERKFNHKTKTYDMVQVETEKKFQDKIKDVCKKRKDDWGTIVKGRLNYAADCRAQDVIYHHQCSSNFRNLQPMPSNVTEDEPPKKRRRIGRPENKDCQRAFQLVLEYLDSGVDDQVTVRYLVDIMGDFFSDTASEPFKVAYMKKKLVEHYGESIVIASKEGKADVITFTDTASSILRNFFEAPKNSDAEEEKIRLMNTAGNLIRNEIKHAVANKDHYPKKDDMDSVDKNLAFLPQSLKQFLQAIIITKDCELKIASIGQAIMQAAVPRSIIAPLQLGLGVQLHHQLSTRFFVDHIHKLGFCTSYTEVRRYEANAASSLGKDLPVLQNGQFAQFIGDNVDHNTQTLDGLHTFHGMGLLAAITPGDFSCPQIPRLNPSINEIIRLGKISTHFHADCPTMPGMTYPEIKICSLSECDKTDNIDFLWSVIRPFSTSVSSWLGTMQNIFNDDHPGKAQISYLPMIDMNPADATCIYSTLHFITNQSLRQNITPVMTFDQPLFWKAQCIIQNEPSNSPLRTVVLRLGPFHTQMSFLGCIGHVMTATGLSNILEEIYAPNFVVHMLTGKAVYRAVRGHLLVESALYSLLVSDAFGFTLDPDGEEEEAHAGTSTSHKVSPPVNIVADKPQNLVQAEELMTQLMDPDETQSVDDVCCHEIITTIRQVLNAHITSLKGRTSDLWLQYMEMVYILRKFLKAERTGNFMLHVETLANMLPYFAACGHNNYTKSTSIYLKNIKSLEQSNPHVFNELMRGNNVIRRTERFWAGLSPDLVIEQVLMKGLKTSGGLSRGRGFSESQRTLWTLSMPARAEMNNVMQDLTAVSFLRSEQHRELGRTRRQRDTKDLGKLINFFLLRNPFVEDPSLRNIMTGEEANPTVNVDKAKDVGHKIMLGIQGKEVSSVSFHRKHQAVTMGSKGAVKIDGEKVHIDQQLLFQRLAVMAKKTCSEDGTIFKYELCSYPPALFHSDGLPLEANKASLAQYLWKEIAPQYRASTTLPKEIHYVLDGGSLLHRISWPRGSTYSAITNMYADYVVKAYGEATVVFDGYQSGPTTKDVTHLRRKAGIANKTVQFKEDMVIAPKKDVFLSNEENKQKFIFLLSDALKKMNCVVYHAEADADGLIVEKALESAQEWPTALIGDDTDLLVLLLHHCTESSEGKIFFAPEKKRQSREERKIWDVGVIKGILGSSLCSSILFCHAFSGCDTVSRVFGVGKQFLLKKLQTEMIIQDDMDLFYLNSNQEAIIKAGERIMFHIYGGSASSASDLDELRFLKFQEKAAASATYVQSTSLPPTAAATKYHSMRVYLQIQKWINDESPLDAEAWGWEIRNGRMYPRYTDLPPAPPELLHTIRCSCKSDCTSMKCTCRKNGLDCSVACKECKGTSCSNITRVPIEDDDEDENYTNEEEDYDAQEYLEM